MTGVAEYVGAEPEGLRRLAGTLDIAAGELRNAGDRIQTLLAEAGEGDVTCGALPTLASEASFAAGDVRRRAVIAEDLAAIAEAPVCVVPWYDPLRRAAVAVGRNTWQFGAGAVDSAGEVGSTIWRLTPVNGEWRQEWVNLAAGLRAAKENPRAAFDAATGMPELDERGYSYWLGGVIPDLAASLFGGLGVAKRTTATVDVVSDVADVAEDTADVAAKSRALDRLSRAALARTNNAVVPGENPRPSLFDRPRPDPEIEPVAKARVLDVDERVGGHSAARHGPETTLEQQRVRAATGRTPDGENRSPQHSSRFFRWQDLDAAVEEAVRRWKPGSHHEKIPFDHLVGEGYLKGGGQYVETSVVRVMFNRRGEPYTAFPDLTEAR